jgi:SAM-dependent methyltransferase
MEGATIEPRALTEHLGEQIVHGKATRVTTDPLTVSTLPAQWSYALSYRPRPDLLGADNALSVDLRCVLEVSVASGRVGIGWTNPEDTAFIEERFVSGETSRVAFTLRSGTRVGRLMFRNVASGGMHSVFSIREARSEVIERGGRTYPVAIAARHVQAEPVPDDGGTDIVFDTNAARAINAARLEWLAQANLPVAGSRVLDVGAGVGHFIPFYLDRGCTVVAVDGRTENVAELKRRHQDVEAHAADAQTLEPQHLGVFDVVHCFGLLYHLESPIAALRRLSAMCRRLLILETMVCDSSEPLMVLVDETRAASQAMEGLGSRPSPSFIALALNRVGFEYVYGSAEVPQHPEFVFEWKNNLDTTRNGRPLRCVIVASKVPLDVPALSPLLEP